MEQKERDITISVSNWEYTPSLRLSTSNSDSIISYTNVDGNNELVAGKKLLTFANENNVV